MITIDTSNSFSAGTPFRVTGSIIVSIVITFALFVSMYEMIRNDARIVKKALPPLIVDPIFKEFDEKVISMAGKGS